MDRVARDRLRWKCRRGLLELDIVLDRFLRRDGDGLRQEELRQLDALLALPDHELWEIVAGRSERFDNCLRGLVTRLRNC